MLAIAFSPAKIPLDSFPALEVSIDLCGLQDKQEICKFHISK
jgi:hypothetical protein